MACRPGDQGLTDLSLEHEFPPRLPNPLPPSRGLLSRKGCAGCFPWGQSCSTSPMCKGSCPNSCLSLTPSHQPCLPHALSPFLGPILRCQLEHGLRVWDHFADAKHHWSGQSRYDFWSYCTDTQKLRGVL